MGDNKIIGVSSTKDTIHVKIAGVIDHKYCQEEIRVSALSDPDRTKDTEAVKVFSRVQRTCKESVDDEYKDDENYLSVSLGLEVSIDAKDETINDHI